MIELGVLFMVGFSTGLSGAMIPGPLFLYTVSEAFRHGQIAGLKVTAGHLLIETGFAALVIIGLREWLVSSAFRTGVAWIGGVSLVLMGLLILSRVRHLSLARNADVSFRWGTLAGGAFFSIASPGFLLWWATIGAAVFLEGALRGAAGIAMVAAGHAVADLSWNWLVALSVERGRDYCTDRVYRLIVTAMAACLIVLGVGLPVKALVGPSP